MIAGLPSNYIIYLHKTNTTILSATKQATLTGTSISEIGLFGCVWYFLLSWCIVSLVGRKDGEHSGVGIVEMHKISTIQNALIFGTEVFDGIYNLSSLVMEFLFTMCLSAERSIHNW